APTAWDPRRDVSRATSLPLRTPGSRPRTGCRSRPADGSARPATTPSTSSCAVGQRSTPSSASTTCWPSRPSVPSTTTGCVCPMTSPWSGGTTSARRGTPGRRSRRSGPTRRPSRGSPSRDSCPSSTATNDPRRKSCATTSSWCGRAQSV
ncbi:MAG: hypothetical protein AVDCRST_MAG32-2690, partial [uncultured Nocardioides sp.]